ncbi:MAG TPA: glycosyltransferase [Acidimicrobiales bacterium]|nr:glycosyltransferase [Acidimicrobiales bacterium]
MTALPMVTVVVPTRDEAANVAPLVERLARAFAARALAWEVLFVDDSDDDTPAAVRKAAERAPVRLHHRPRGKRHGGLGGAVQDGFAAARGDVLAVMDADLQHPPELVPLLVAPILEGWADLVAGTRYGDEDHVDGLAGPWRRGVSTGSRRLVHMAVSRSRCLSDPMSGLFAFDRSVIDGVVLRTNGFKILLEVAARGRPLRVHNLAYHFAERHAGASKANVAQGGRFLAHLARLAVDRRHLRSLPDAAAALGRDGPRPAARATPVSYRPGG